MFCGADSRSVCTGDGTCTGGAKCVQVPGGTVSTCQQPGRCLLRVACSDCAVDDQCPSGHVCATDVNGGRFCGKLCDPKNMDGDCPQPANDSNSGVPIGDLFEKCVAAAHGSSLSVCRPTVGACSGPSPLKQFAGKSDTMCSWCRVGEPADCGDGECYEDEFTKERFCTRSCTVHLTNSGGMYTPSNDTCPKGTACFASFNPNTCSSECDASGLCTADTTLADLTCYPLPP
jgi:hypothetical protein